MNTKKLAASIAALGMLTASSFALARGPVDRLADQLDLTDDQTTTITALFEAHRGAMHAEFGERGEGGRPDPETRGQMRSAREALHQEILSVLDADQAAQFEQIVAERHERRGGDGRSGKGIKAALAQLDLSKVQQDAITALVAEQEAERGANRDRFRSELASILTDEQLAQMEAMREVRPGRRGR